MRKLRKSWIGIVLVFLFGISLFFWRQGSCISNILNSDNVIAKVGQTPISTTKFNRTLEMNIQQFNRMLDKSLSSEEIRNFQIHNLALNALINDAVFENEFDRLNFIIDEKIIAEKTKEMIPEKNIRINASGCLDQCEYGPTMVVYPDNVWYAYKSEDDVNLIIQEHLINNRIVGKLLLKK